MRRTVLVVGVTVVATVSALPASAVRPTAECGLGFELMTIEETLPLVSEGSPNPPEVLLEALQAIDKNDDELVCVKDLPDHAGVALVRSQRRRQHRDYKLTRTAIRAPPSSEGRDRSSRAAASRNLEGIELSAFPHLEPTPGADGGP
jgi:hypothetical protein